MTTEKVVPVALSVLIIVLVATVQARSRHLAAVLALASAVWLAIVVLARGVAAWLR
jgi:hypothetical protein